MGCDIHIVLERNVDDRWVGVNPFRYFLDIAGEARFPAVTARNYERFAKLAGVRGAGPEPLGIPDDASDLSRLLIKRCGSDGHSHSHMPADQFVRIFLETERRKETPFSRWAEKFPVNAYLGIEEKFDGPVSEYRVVFWFDS